MKGLLLNAFESQEPIEMIYMSERGKISQRIVRLEEIQETYIKAFCLLRNQRRIFRLSNILSMRLAKDRRKKRWVS